MNRLQITQNKNFPSIFLALTFICFLFFQPIFIAANGVIFFPVNGAIAVNPDTHLEITFRNAPVLGKSGQIRIYDAADHHLVDLLDLSIPAGPTIGDTAKNAVYMPFPYDYTLPRFTNANTKPGTPSGIALPNNGNYQRTIIGGFTDGFHFYPVIVHGNKATIYLHNNLLEYGKKYFVQIDPEVFTLKDNSFSGITAAEWTFTVKPISPSLQSERLVVSADGSGDFNTVQGAIDHIPDYNLHRITIFIKNGIYEEIVYFRNKSNITILGENRDRVVVQYANNEVFNPHPSNVRTNEVAGTFPSRRAAFAVDHCKGIHLANLTIKTTAKGQAEGLLLNGEENIIRNVTIVGSGDALQSNGSAYFSDCSITGDGDTVLGRGPSFFNHCEFYSYGAYMWIRNTEANHGNVCLNCMFKTLGKGETEIARSPTNKGNDYPFAEVVLINCKLLGISPIGWGPVGGEISNIHFWEYNSTNYNDGTMVDVSHRHPASRQLTIEKDSVTISNYMNPAYVLNGWVPKI